MKRSKSVTLKNSATFIADTADIIHGTIAEYCKEPTRHISAENTVAVTGVPNIAEKQALIPHMVIIFLSSSSNFRICPNCEPILPPIWSAAPSRPLEPPRRCVITDEIKMHIVFLNPIFSPSRAERSTRLVPLSFGNPIAL